MSAIERLRNGLFMDSPKHATPENQQQIDAIKGLREDANKLADAIEDEQTCHNVSVEGECLLLCSHCGAFTQVTNAVSCIGVRYCGNCGAKVVAQ